MQDELKIPAIHHLVSNYEDPQCSKDALAKFL
jgi:hypothetical protein